MHERKQEAETLKMRDLERVSGVGRETIRFYIREGLLPEPDRPKRNVARYTQAHVDRLRAIRKLQQERFLPLSVIKTIVRAEGDAVGAGIAGFIGLENVLVPMLSDPKNLEPRTVASIAEEMSIPVETIEWLIETGLVRADKAGGERWLDGRNARVVALWKELVEMGFSPEAGYLEPQWKIYAAFLDWLVREEVNIFYKNLAPKMGQEQAGVMASAGVRIMNEIIPLMRTDRVVRAVAEISERGELPELDADGEETA
ncbi:MAG: MerR family transcriptional regulator [Parvibaculum sp.]